MPIFLFSALILTLALCPAAAAGSSALDVHQQAAGAVTAESRAQAEYQQWADDRETLSAEVRDMKAMDDWLEFQNRKYKKYVKRQEAAIAELERRKEEAKRIRRELEPFLESVVTQLEAFVAEDLPFLAEERAQRLKFLHESLDDYHLQLSEKLRRVFEVLLVETEYGRSVSTETGQLDLDGSSTRVAFFRLGRTALFYQTADGSEAGMWDRQAKGWRPLDANFARTLQLARDMAGRKRAVELLRLPLGAPR